MLMQQTGPITKRIKSPETVTLKEGTVIVLCYKRSERVHNHGSSVIEVSFKLTNGKEELILETDTVLNWGHMPQLATNRAAWEKVRDLVANSSYTPDDAYLEVAFEHIVKRWKFDLDYADDAKVVHLNLVRSKLEHENLVATTTSGELLSFFDFDFAAIDQELEDDLLDEDLEEEGAYAE